MDVSHTTLNRHLNEVNLAQSITYCFELIKLLKQKGGVNLVPVFPLHKVGEVIIIMRVTMRRFDIWLTLHSVDWTIEANLIHACH